jgi:hypothetical protein
LLVILLSIVLYAAMLFIAWGILVLSEVVSGDLISTIRSIFSDPITAVDDIYIDAYLEAFPWNEFWWLVGLYIGFQVAVAIKQAFIDSWMMIRSVVMFFDFAPTTQIRFDTHERLCQVSPAFRRLSDKARLRGSFDTAPNNFAPNNFAPNNTAPNNFAPNNTAPNNFVPSNFVPNNFAPNNIASNNVAPNDMGSICGVCGAAVIGKFCHGCGRQQ